MLKHLRTVSDDRDDCECGSCLRFYFSINRIYCHRSHQAVHVYRHRIDQYRRDLDDQQRNRIGYRALYRTVFGWGQYGDGNICSRCDEIGVCDCHHNRVDKHLRPQSYADEFHVHGSGIAKYNRPRFNPGIVAIVGGV